MLIIGLDYHRGFQYIVAFQLLPLLPQASQKMAHAWGEVVLGIFEDGGRLAAQLGRPFSEGDAALQ